MGPATPIILIALIVLPPQYFGPWYAPGIIQRPQRKVITMTVLKGLLCKEKEAFVARFLNTYSPTFSIRFFFVKLSYDILLLASLLFLYQQMLYILHKKKFISVAKLSFCIPKVRRSNPMLARTSFCNFLFLWVLSQLKINNFQHLSEIIWILRDYSNIK